MPIIEHARLEDAEAINKLYDELIHWGHPSSVDSIKTCINTPLHDLMVIRDSSGEGNGGVVCGSALLSRRLVPDHHIGWVATIDSVIVGEKWRGRSYGKMLTEALIDMAKNHGCLKVELTVRSDPDRAHAFELYKNLGFKIVSTSEKELASGKQLYCVLDF